MKVFETADRLHLVVYGDSNVFFPRKVALNRVIPPLVSGSTGFYRDLVPLVSSTLDTMSLLEAMYVTFDRAAYARQDIMANVAGVAVVTAD